MRIDCYEASREVHFQFMVERNGTDFILKQIFIVSFLIYSAELQLLRT